MIIRFLKVLWEWLFGIRGYLSFEPYVGSLEQQQEIALASKIIGGSARHQKCKVCGKSFWAMKHNPTCKRISCFFAYRMKKHSSYSVVAKHKGVEKNHIIHAHSISEVLGVNLPGKIKQISKVK